MVAIVLLCSSQSILASVFLSQLTQLEEIRLINFTSFSAGLAELEKVKSSFTEEESQYFALLKGYEKSLAGEYEQAFIYLAPLIQSTSSGIYHFRAKVLAVNLYAISHDYLNAFLLLGELNKELPFIDDAVARAQAVGNIAMLYNGIEKYEIALFYSEQFLNSIKDQQLVCRVLVHKLTSLANLKKNSDFLSEIDHGIATCRKSKEKIPEIIMLRDKMQVLLHLERLSEITSLYQSISEDVVATGYPMLIAGILNITAQAYLRAGDLSNAELLAATALRQIEHTSINFVQTELYKLLADLEKRKGNFEAALAYFEKHSALEKTYQDDKTNQQLAFHLAEGELEVKDKRIALLDKDNELLSLQKNLYEHEVKQNRLLLLLLFSVLIIASFMAYRGMSGRKRFKKIAEFDQLTGISNRYHFNNLAKVALDYCELNAKPAALILFDLDYFKTINDNYGHATGDWALQQVVKTCRNFMRNNDVFGRIGGEEFAVVLPGCHADKAALLAEICRDAIATIDTTESGYQFPLSASFGVSSSDISGYQLKQLLADADLAMYSAKQSGRDQIATYTHLMDTAD
ncbi:diguanylate cyclase (GGDEF) domain-containing protein [Rheinheimera pacifica]|uniref:diguanylate cyclase n=2 Tax=Rheinheimera pacifica TaxID=173990 RepID=A0A1H6LQT0_9GAMM|nr:diguanylate cyclase (GGDEF) domain-containing protein [Rheinheimera pacifica]